MTTSNPNPAWPLPSDDKNAEESIFPPACRLQLIQPSIRERAFDAAQRLILSQPHMAVGRLEQNRLADYVIEMAERFEGWMRAAPTPDLRTFGDNGGEKIVAPLDQADGGAEIDLDALLAAVAAKTALHCETSGEPIETGDPTIDAYIESDKRVVSLTQAMLEEQVKMAARMTVVEDKVASLVRSRAMGVRL